jgi:hypothetical protein
MLSIYECMLISEPDSNFEEMEEEELAGQGLYI